MLMTLLSLDMILLILGFENCNKIFGHLLIWKTLVPWPFFLGSKLDIPTVGYFSLYKCTEELIDPAHLIDSKNVDTPMEVNVKYHKDYGRLYWTTTRPGISYGQFCHLIYVQSKTPLIVVFCIIKYLHALYGGFILLIYISTSFDCLCCCWLGRCPNTRCLTTGWRIFLGDSQIMEIQEKRSCIIIF